MHKLIGTKWSITGGVFGKNKLTIEFQEKCVKCEMVINTLTYEYFIEGNQLSFGDGWETLAAGSRERMELDTKFKTMLKKVKSFEISKNILILFDEHEEPVFVLTPWFEEIPMQIEHSEPNFTVTETVGEGFINPKGLSQIIIAKEKV